MRSVLFLPFVNHFLSICVLLVMSIRFLRLKKIGFETTSHESRLFALDDRNWCDCSIEKKFHISNLEHFSLELWRTNKFHEICTSRGEFITRDSGLLKMPGKLVLLSDMIMVDEVECRNTNWKLQRVYSL